MKKYNIILYAPNINNGGGLVLLKNLISRAPKNLDMLYFLDDRARTYFESIDSKKYWIKPKFFSRLWSETLLFFLSYHCEVCFCFHGLPPILPLRAKTIVFLQNRILIETSIYNLTTKKTFIRLLIERFLAKLFHMNVDAYIVQTNSMRIGLAGWIEDRFCRRKSTVLVMPFADLMKKSKLEDKPSINYDFLYPADGEGHKNHKNLFDAWVLLARDGIYPVLALTLNENKYLPLISTMKELIRKHGLKIVNLGVIDHESMSNVYVSSSALIYPSFSESFGLPLIEARHLGLPILASELDYVRDVASPVQSFNPNSSKSIASAVKRYMCIADDPIKVSDSACFWQKLGEFI